MRLAAIVVALAAFAGAQTSSTSTATSTSSNAWNFNAILQGSSDIVVADIVSGGGVDDGSQVTMRARIRVVRVLHGGLVPGAEVDVKWQYKPTLMETPALTSKLPLERGVWFLHGAEALRASIDTLLGGAYLPAGGVPRYYPADAPMSHKVAAELAPAIEEIVTRHGADLTPRPYGTITPGVIPEWARAVGWLNALLMALQGVDSGAKKEVYADFSARPDPFLKGIGISGRLQGGDASALLDLETNLATVYPIFHDGAVRLGGIGVDLRNNLPAARALARLATGETAIPEIEGNAAMQLAGTHSAEFLPYFVVMLASPTPFTRDSVLMAFCPLLRDGPFWKAEMAAHCPNRSPLNDAAAEQAEIQYWTSWWEATRGQIAKTTPLADVRPPARYNTSQVPVTIRQIPLEYRFDGLVNMTRNGRPDPVSAQLSESDRAVFREVTADVNAKLEVNQRRVEEMMNAARLAGKMPEPAQMRAVNDERNAILKAGINDIRNRLSPAGWQVVENFLNQMMGGGMIASPAKQ